MNGVFHIGRAAQLLNITSGHLRVLERVGRILPLVETSTGAPTPLSTTATVQPPDGEAARERLALREADRRGLLLRWSEHPSCMKLHDLMDGSWHGIRAAEYLPSVVESANIYQKRGGGGR